MTMYLILFDKYIVVKNQKVMYTIQENVLIVISLLKQYNIRHIVISPGGTNIPISQAVQDDDFFHCYSVTDERSAMYFAIGIYLQTGEIVATSCTSAQATRNYVPGLTEAFYKHVPILAITTSKLERFAYQDYMQAPDQCSLPKDSVKKSYDLPPVTDINTRVQCVNNAIEAILELTHHNLGPVQLNLRINDAVQSNFEEEALPQIVRVDRYAAWDEWNVTLKSKKVLIVVGEHRPFTEKQQTSFEAFCKSTNSVVYVNHLSNYSGKYAIQANLLLSCGGISQLQPDILITIGGQTGDYSVFGSLNENKNVEHWRVSEDGDFVNTYNRLTKIFECPDWLFFERMAGKENVTHSYFEAWSELNSSLKLDVELPFSNLYVAQQLHKDIPSNSIMNFAILNSLRCWNYFPLDKRIEGYGNVAAFGIDGCNSMLIGESMNTDKLSFIITGDLAFFYDMNSLGIRHIKNNVRILLINNNSGAEFGIMTEHWKIKPTLERFISASGHNGNAKGWAENCGFEYLSANTKEEFQKIKSSFLAKHDKPVLMECFTHATDEALANDTFLCAQTIKKEFGPLKKVVKTILGDNGVKLIKKIVKK